MMMMVFCCCCSCCRFLILIVAIISLVHTLSIVASNANVGPSKYDRTWKKKKKSCESNTCEEFIPDEAYNCVNKCLSEECFRKIYQENPLEDGEIDTARSRQFTQCMRNEMRENLMLSRNN